MQSGAEYRKNGVLIFSALLFFTLFAACRQENRGQTDRASLSLDNKNPVPAYSETITLDQLRDHVVILASDEMEGRQSGSPGAQAAAEYIASRFKEKELEGFFPGEDPYFQKFDMEKKEILECFLENQNGRADNWTDFLEIEGDYMGDREVDLVF